MYSVNCLIQPDPISANKEAAIQILINFSITLK